MEKMLTVVALDERDLLLKKIKDKTRSLNPITCKRIKDPKVKNGQTVEEFTKEAQADFQQLTDLIDRYKRLNAAIVQANATEEVDVKGKKMSRAAAIALKKIAREGAVDPERSLLVKLSTMYNSAMDEMSILQKEHDNFERNLNSTTSTRESDLSEAQISSIKTLAEGYQPELIDPLDLRNKIEKELEDYDEFIAALETAIKTSNALSYVEF